MNSLNKIVDSKSGIRCPQCCWWRHQHKRASKAADALNNTARCSHHTQTAENLQRKTKQQGVIIMEGLVLPRKPRQRDRPVTSPSSTLAAAPSL
jgi:hypothetical protein